MCLLFLCLSFLIGFFLFRRRSLGRPGNLNQNTPPPLPQPNLNLFPLPTFPPQTPGTAVVSPDNRQVRYLPITPPPNPIDPSLEKPTTSTTKPNSPHPTSSTAHPFSSPSPPSSSSSPSHSSTSFLPLPSFPLNLDVKIEVGENDDDDDDDFEK
jgi:hypothetical protein